MQYQLLKFFPMLKPVIFSPQIKAHKIVYVIEYAIRCRPAAAPWGWLRLSKKNCLPKFCNFWGEAKRSWKAPKVSISTSSCAGSIQSWWTSCWVFAMMRGALHNHSGFYFFSWIILNHHVLLPRSFLTAVIEHIWNQFKSAPVNDESKYAKPETGELKHCLFPNFPLLRKSANYTRDCLNQDSRAKEDSCEKNFPTHRQLTPGLLLMTCACQLKVVYGFSMMMTGESPRMLFEVIMNRFENDYSPDIIYDASCKLKEYALNREPKRFMSIRVTSDRFHENNHKTCSSSFKTSSYPSLCSANSEACEQFNSVLRRISSSTTYMQQSLFMRAITLFIADPNIFANKKNKQQVQNADPLFFYLFCLSCDICAHICEGICACFDFS